MSGYGDDEGYAEYMEGQAADDEAAWQASESASAEADAAAADEAARFGTPERDHSHVCPTCGDSWLHADSECDYAAVEIVPGYPLNQTWATCPICEEGA